MKKVPENEKDFQNKHRTEWKDFLWDKFLDRVAKTKTKQEAGDFLNALFSEYEKETIIRRLAALALIRSGKGVREIGRVLWMSTGTIGAIKKNFFLRSKAYKSQRSLKALQQPEPLAEILTNRSWLEALLGDIEVDLWELIKNPPRPPGIGLKRK